MVRITVIGAMWHWGAADASRATAGRPWMPYEGPFDGPFPVRHHAGHHDRFYLPCRDEPACFCRPRGAAADVAASLALHLAVGPPRLEASRPRRDGASAAGKARYRRGALHVQMG